jgi:hypothetical protein
VAAKAPLAVLEVIRTERPGGSAFVQLFPPGGWGRRRLTTVLTFLREAGPWAEQKGAECAASAGPENLAIVTLLSQLTFASDTPIDGDFRGWNALSGHLA